MARLLTSTRVNQRASHGPSLAPGRSRPTGRSRDPSELDVARNVAGESATDARAKERDAQTPKDTKHERLQQNTGHNEYSCAFCSRTAPGSRLARWRPS